MEWVLAEARRRSVRQHAFVTLSVQRSRTTRDRCDAVQTRSIKGLARSASWRRRSLKCFSLIQVHDTAFERAGPRCADAIRALRTGSIVAGTAVCSSEMQTATFWQPDLIDGRDETGDAPRQRLCAKRSPSCPAIHRNVAHETENRSGQPSGTVVDHGDKRSRRKTRHGTRDPFARNTLCWIAKRMHADLMGIAALTQTPRANC